MKFYYFDCYAYGEHIRMALHLAKIEYEDIRFPYDAPREEFNKLKSQGLFEFGQVPMLEFDDGKRYVQTNAILNFLGAKYGLIPSDPDAAYRGYMVKDLLELDFLKKHVYQAVWYTEPGPEQFGLLDIIWNTHLPAFLEKLHGRLSLFPESKFLCGNEVTIFDIFVAGSMLNIMLNPLADRADGWKFYMDKHSSPLVEQYIANFEEVMGDYLKNRPDSKY